MTPQGFTPRGGGDRGGRGGGRGGSNDFGGGGGFRGGRGGGGRGGGNSGNDFGRQSIGGRGSGNFSGRQSGGGRGFSGGGRGGPPRGRGGPRGGARGGGGMRGGKKVSVEPHRIQGVYIIKGKEDALATRNFAPGESVYGEKRVSVQSDPLVKESNIEYRIWNPFRSKLAAAIMSGVEDTHIKPGAKVLYLGAASGTSVSHVSDIIGQEGIVYAIEFSHRSGRDLLNVAKKRTNLVPIVEDARHPHKYSMIVGAVDVIFADVAQPNQAQIVAQNAQKFLKNDGFAVISIKANCIDSTAEPEAVFAGEVNKLREEQFKPIEQVTLEPYERDHAVVVAQYRPGVVAKKRKTA